MIPERIKPWAAAAKQGRLSGLAAKGYPKAAVSLYTLP